jgi:hypothetical protein
VPTLFVRAGDGLVIGGSVEVEGQARMRMTFWHSADAKRWQQTFARFGGRPVSMVSSGDTVIVGGDDGYSRKIWYGTAVADGVGRRRSDVGRRAELGGRQ